MWIAVGQGDFGCCVSLVVAMDAAVGFDFLEKGGNFIPGTLYEQVLDGKEKREMDLFIHGGWISDHSVNEV